MSKRSELEQLSRELRSVPCADCGRSFDPACMDFDHRDGSTKIGPVSMFVNRANREGFLLEVAKCDIVCACCHRLRTKQRGHSAETIEKLRQAGKKFAAELWKRPGYKTWSAHRARRRKRLMSALFAELREMGVY